jgi:hypothetical protein
MKVLMAQQNVDSDTAAETLRLLEEQRELCRQLSGFAAAQRALITGDEPERLLAVLGDRQQVLDRLSVIVDRLRPVQRRWGEVRASLTPAQARQADALITEVNTLLAGILKGDEADAQLLSARKTATGQSLQQVGQGRQAGAAYAAGAAPAVSRVDWIDE